MFIMLSPIRLSFAALLLLICSCSQPVYTSLWQTAQVKADGNPTEWSKPLKHYDATTKLQFTFSNDLQNMYVCIRATDETAQQKILKGGLELWIDTTGNTKERIGIKFPLPEAEAKSAQRNENRQEEISRDTRSKKKFRSDKTEMELVGFKGAAGGVMPIKNIYGIATNINMDSLDILTYEAIIPFKTFFKDSLSARDSLKVIGLKIVLNGVPTAKKGGKGVADPSADLGSSAGGMGGRRPGASSRGPSGDRGPSNPLYESHTIKSKLNFRTRPGPVVRKWE
jgi:hypothetical protein